MNVRTAYLHVLDGRLRIKVDRVKGSPAGARQIEARLASIDGVDHVSANPTTGNVLVLYRHGRLTQADVLRAIQALGFLAAAEESRAVPRGVVVSETGVVGRVAETVAKSVMEVALQSLVAALI